MHSIPDQHWKTDLRHSKTMKRKWKEKINAWDAQKNSGGNWSWRHSFTRSLLARLSNDDGDVNENGIKLSNRFRLAKQQLCTCITLFCTFLCRHCMTTTCKCLINFLWRTCTQTRQWLSSSFSELRYSLLEFNSRKNCQHLTNRTRKNKRDKVWSSVTSFFKWRFRSRRHRCCSKELCHEIRPN